MASQGYSGQWGKLICEKSQKLKILRQAFFKLFPKRGIYFMKWQLT